MHRPQPAEIPENGRLQPVAVALVVADGKCDLSRCGPCRQASTVPQAVVAYLPRLLIVRQTEGPLPRRVREGGRVNVPELWFANQP